ncbi:MAG: cyclic nucleotide-binding domain-containing protein [Spirochaetota bacterium]
MSAQPEGFIREFKQGDRIFSQGDKANGCMFFVYEGSLTIYRELEIGLKEIGCISKGQFFGEVGLIRNDTRTATVIVDSDTVRLGEINKKNFALLAVKKAEFLFSLMKNTIHNILRAQKQLQEMIGEGAAMQFDEPDLSDGDEENYMVNWSILDYVRNVSTQFYRRSDYIFKEGDDSDGNMYFVIDGVVMITKKIDGMEQEIVEFSEGGFFGEMALINDSPRTASARSKTLQLKIAKLNKDIFMKICRTSPQFLYNILKTIISRLIAVDQKIYSAGKKQDD